MSCARGALDNCSSASSARSSSTAAVGGSAGTRRSRVRRWPGRRCDVLVFQSTHRSPPAPYAGFALDAIPTCLRSVDCGTCGRERATGPERGACGASCQRYRKRSRQGGGLTRWRHVGGRRSRPWALETWQAGAASLELRGQPFGGRYGCVRCKQRLEELEKKRRIPTRRWETRLPI